MSESHPSVLLETIAGRLDKSVGLTRLQHVLGASLLELQEMGQDFSNTVGQLPDYARQALSQEIQSVEGALEAYHALLLAARQQPDDERLTELQEAFGQAAEELNLASLAFREAALAERGPTSHAGLNLLLMGAVRSQDLELLRAQAEAAQRQLTRVASNPLTVELASFQWDYLALLQTAHELSTEDLERNCLKLGHRFQRVDLAGLVRRLSSQPTPLPAINLILNGRRLEQEGHVHPEVVEHFLAAARQQLADSRQRHQEVLDVVSGHPLQSRLERAYNMLEQALEGPPAELDRAAHFLGSVWLVLGASAEAERGRLNVKDTGSDDGQTTVRAERLLAQAEVVLSGGDAGPLLALVDEMERGRRQADAQLERLTSRLGAFPAEEQARARQAAELFESGVQELGQSLEHFRELARTGSRALLRPAAETLWNALDQIFEVQHRLRPFL